MTTMQAALASVFPAIANPATLPDTPAPDSPATVAVVNKAWEAREITFEKEGILVVLLHNPSMKNNNESVSKVFWNNAGKKDKWVWTKPNYPSFSHSRYYEDGDNAFIVIVTKGSIADVLDIKKLPNYVLVNLDGGYPVYEGRGIKIGERIERKQALAKKLGLQYELLPDEALASKLISKDTTEKRDQEKAARDAIAEEARQKRIEEGSRIRALVASRPRLKGYTTEATYFNGAPVVEGEWERLEKGSRCVLVRSYNDEKKTYGDILGCFMIEKRGTQKIKSKEGEFSFKANSTSVSVKPVMQVAYKDADNDVCTANVYASFDALETLRSAGLNSGTIVALQGNEETDGKGMFRLYSMSKSKITLKGSVLGVTM